MSESGHLQTFGEPKRMSALPPKADIAEAREHVRLGPITDIRCFTRSPRLHAAGTAQRLSGRGLSPS